MNIPLTNRFEFLIKVLHELDTNKNWSKNCYTALQHDISLQNRLQNKNDRESNKTLEILNKQIILQQIAWVGLTMLSNKQNCSEARFLGYRLYFTTLNFYALVELPSNFVLQKSEVSMLQDYELVDLHGAIIPRTKALFLSQKDYLNKHPVGHFVFKQD